MLKYIDSHKLFQFCYIYIAQYFWTYEINIILTLKTLHFVDFFDTLGCFLFILTSCRSVCVCLCVCWWLQSELNLQLGSKSLAGWSSREAAGCVGCMARFSGRHQPLFIATLWFPPAKHFPLTPTRHSSAPEAMIKNTVLCLNKNDSFEHVAHFYSLHIPLGSKHLSV